jgi:hypothetical protein
MSSRDRKKEVRIRTLAGPDWGRLCHVSRSVSPDAAATASLSVDASPRARCAPVMNPYE